jgi:predicted AlkP superfamily pyrophosphatase or phosphodiesterase
MRHIQKLSLLLVLLLGFSIAPTAAAGVKNLKPTVILISIDGFRADYLEVHRPKYLNKLANQGVRAKWMEPSFPTKTFPNHYTIATGLYPQNHGIIANNIYDSGFDAVFALRKREEVQNARWWSGEPIWTTAEKQGQKAGAYFFPGTETPIGGKHISIWKGYDGKIANFERVDTLLSWFDLPETERPTMMTLYFSDVDDAGHRYSPTSEEAGNAVRIVDQSIKRLLSGLKMRGIRNKVNLIIVSDHGMAPVPKTNSIVLDEMFNVNDAERVFWVGELLQIFPKPGKEDSIYAAINKRLPSSAKIYKRQDIPARFNYRNNKRIPPLLVLPDEGWVLTTRKRYEKMESDGILKSTGGSHGYDNELESMRALFIAHGPAFKRKYVSEPFKNVEVYNLMCDVLGLKAAPNDGNFDNVKNILRNH